MSKKSVAGAETKEQGGEVGAGRRTGLGAAQETAAASHVLGGAGGQNASVGLVWDRAHGGPKRKHHPWETQLCLPCLPPPGREALINKSPITARGSFASSPSQGQSTRLELSLSLLRLVEVFSHVLRCPEVSKQTRAMFSLLSCHPTRTCGAPRNSTS